MVDRADARVLWVSPSYGYAGDLMYFRDIFAGFVAAFPATDIPVDRDFPVDRYPELPLRPILTGKAVALKRGVGKVGYEAGTRLPSPSLLPDLLRARPDLVVAIEFTPTALVGAIVARLRRRPLLLLIENDPRFRGAVPGGAFHRLKQIVARSAALVMTSGPDGLRYVTDDLGVPASRVMMAPYLTSVPPAWNGSSLLDRDPDRINALFLNSVNERKGVRELIEAAGRLSRDRLDRFRFHIVGDGPLLPNLRALVAEKKLDAAFRFYGRVPYAEIGGYYSAADLAIAPTLADYRSLAGFEALAYGLPVLISKGDGAAPEVVEHGVNGYIVDPADSDGFADHLASIADDPALLERFAAASRTRAPRFSVEAIVGNLVSAADRALGASTRLQAPR